MIAGPQTAGVPGSFPLPNADDKGTAFRANSMHPSAAAAIGPSANPMNAARPALLGGKK